MRREEVRRGQVLSAPGSVTPHIGFTARMLALAAAEGGRHTPFAADYRPQFHIRTADVSGALDLGDLGDVALVMPGDTVVLTVRLGKPVALDVGPGLAVREGSRTVAAGTVTGLVG